MINLWYIEDEYNIYCHECERKGVEPIADMMEWWESLE